MSELDKDLPEQDTFPREYVEKLRNEAARYRTDLKPFKAAVGDFNDQEVAYLLGMIQDLRENPIEGARQFRDMSLNLMQDKFYEGIELPAQEQTAETNDEKEEEMTEPTADHGAEAPLTAAQLQEMLDAREAAAAEARAAQEAEAAQAAEVDAIYKEIEALGFEKGTRAFRTVLNEAVAVLDEGADPNFAEIAVGVRAMHGLPDPAAAPAEGEADGGDIVAEVVEETTAAPRHAVTAGAGGAGAPAETPKDWIAAAKEAGKSPMEAARERLEARLGS